MRKLTFATVLLFSGVAAAQTPVGPAPVPAGGNPGTVTAPPANSPARQSPAVPSPGAPPPASVTPANLSSVDKKFVEKAAQGGMAEVQAAQLAQQKAADQKVKDFAQQMIADHTAANQKLSALAQQKGLTVPGELASKDQKDLDKLGKLDGKKFDRAYLKGQVRDHQDMLSLLQKEAKSGKDPDLKSFAQETIPTVQKHLDMAQSGG
jgi:putative membrane protein